MYIYIQFYQIIEGNGRRASSVFRCIIHKGKLGCFLGARIIAIIWYLPLNIS
jgi:hypothetical protein